MTCRGTVHHGVVELEGEATLAEGTPVQVIPVQTGPESLANMEAFGVWRDRDDFGDSAEAAGAIRAARRSIA